ncbi:hypothetical protein PRIPAC_80180 [Pristionchus pacificus]|nr:hypothetical protein PRIPAC_80180 [Pristionchus pacificus]
MRIRTAVAHSKRSLDCRKDGIPRISGLTLSSFWMLPRRWAKWPWMTPVHSSNPSLAPMLVMCSSLTQLQVSTLEWG